MFYYRIGTVCVIFELLAEYGGFCNKWRMTIYKVGPRGGWKKIKQSTQVYKAGYTSLNHLRDARKS